jgi:hypothetical protein
MSKDVLWSPMYFWDTLRGGIECSLSFFGHEQYSSNSLDQNNLAHGFYNVAQ